MACSARLTEVFTKGKRPAFVAFLTAGYPALATTVPAMLAMQRKGVGLIEVGMPFSDPLADGGTIAKANQGALENGVTLKWTLDMIREARAAGLTIPIVLMGVRRLGGAPAPPWPLRGAGRHGMAGGTGTRRRRAPPATGPLRAGTRTTTRARA
jgi:hypothetical protein